MFKMKKLEELKKQIINKLVTEKNVEEIKEKETLKGGFLKQFFKYVFLKPMFLRETNSNVDKFFTAGKDLNYCKHANLMDFFALSVFGVIISLLEKSFIPIFIFLTGFLILSTLIIISSGVDWVDKNSKANEKFNIKNIKNIRENLLENYSDHQVRYLLKENLNKKELTKIMKELEKLIGKDEILLNFEEIRKLNNYEETFNDISKPYVLVKLIDKLILNEKENEKNSNKKEIKEFNNTIIDSLINNDNNSDEMEDYNKEKHILSIKI